MYDKNMHFGEYILFALLLFLKELEGNWHVTLCLSVY